MNFHEIAQNFADTSSGTDAFKVFYKAVFPLMKSDPENAALYFVTGVAARAFVRSYEDQGITMQFADSAKATLMGYNTKISTALNSDPAKRLQLLGEIATDYEWNVRDF